MIHSQYPCTDPHLHLRWKPRRSHPTTTNLIQAAPHRPLIAYIYSHSQHTQLTFREKSPVKPQAYSHPVKLPPSSYPSTEKRRLSSATQPTLSLSWSLHSLPNAAIWVRHSHHAALIPADAFPASLIAYHKAGLREYGPGLLYGAILLQIFFILMVVSVAERTLAGT